MKNLFKNLMLVAVAAMAFTACTETNEEVNAVNEKVTLTFVADFGEDTRVSLDNSDNNKVYKAAWEEGDTVTFAVFEDADTTTPKEISDAFRVSAPAETVEFTVTFNNGLDEGNVIKAYVNYNVYVNWGWFYTDTEYEQYPSNDGPSCVYASASVVYAEGVDYATLSFEHDYAYGLMTIEDLPFETSYFVITIDGSNLPYINTNVSKGYTGEKLWFYCPEDLDVKEFTVVAYSKDYTLNSTFVRTFAGEGEFAFKKGRVSRFTVSSWKSRLAMPVVESSVSGQTINLSWAPVEGADYYRVTSSAFDDELVDETLAKDVTSYAFNAAKADTYYSFYVYACANNDNETYVTSNGKYVWIQSGNTTPVMTLSKNSLTLDAAGASVDVTITTAFTTSPVSVSVSDAENCEWIQAELNAEGNVLTITASENTGDERSAEIIVSAGGVADQKITVTQRAAGDSGPDGTEANPYTFETVRSSGYFIYFENAENNAYIAFDTDNFNFANWEGTHYMYEAMFYQFSNGSYYKIGDDISYEHSVFKDKSYFTCTKNGDGTFTFKIAMTVDNGQTYTHYVGNGPAALLY